MARLLIIADDFTGALDTGVQFAVSGAATLVETERNIDYRAVEPGIEVLVLDAETRHLNAAKAHKIVARAVADARRAGIPYIYKKTDSALRGNIGAELAAMCEASEEKRVHFIPAFPKMKRITRNGIHYIDGVPVGESVFGQDPFEPVTASSVAEIIGKQSKVPVRLIEQEDGKDPSCEGILIYDAETDKQMKEIAEILLSRNELGFCAGCAGFASVLPEVLGLTGKPAAVPKLSPRLLVACGSVNPITVSQLDYAERKGVPRIRLSGEQKLDREWPGSAAAKACAGEWQALCMERGVCILDSNDRPGDMGTEEYMQENGIGLDGARKSIASNIGSIVKELLDGGLEATLLITGGDTLKGFLEKVGITRLQPICEVTPGAVLSGFRYRDQVYHVISKSGGFGRESLIEDLMARLGISGCAWEMRRRREHPLDIPVCAGGTCEKGGEVKVC